MDRDEFWVFGYGSLMWRPGFDYVERSAAFLRGAHRKLCLYSYVHRGTPDAPGLVLGLDRGGSCKGVAYRIAPEHAETTRIYLHEREQINYAYREVYRPVRLGDGRIVHALVYMVDRSHPQYAGLLAQDEILALVKRGIGQSGPNGDYIRNTVQELARLDIHDATLAWLDERL